MSPGLQLTGTDRAAPAIGFTADFAAIVCLPGVFSGPQRADLVLFPKKMRKFRDYCIDNRLAPL
jgi:hypothetical protein